MRPQVELAHAPELPWAELPADGWPLGATARVLSRDDETGAVTCIVRLPAGYRRPAGHSPADAELLVLSGSVRIGSAVRAFGWYEWAPGGTSQEAWEVDAGCELILFARTGAPDVVPEPGSGAGGRIEVDTEAVPWILTPIPGPPAGIVLKILRRTPEGGTTWLASNVPGFDYPKLEYHDCVEESYCIAGDIWLGNSGTMLPGSYFWRPPYVTHGPFYSLRGGLRITHTDGPLVNHFPDDPRRTPEENRREAEAEGPPRDYISEAA